MLGTFYAPVDNLFVLFRKISLQDLGPSSNQVVCHFAAGKCFNLM